MDLICQRCAHTFSGEPERKFCSRSCAAIFNNTGRNRHGRKGRFLEKPCAACGVGTRNLRYCSVVCRANASRKSEDHKRAVRRLLSKISFSNYCARLRNAIPAGTDMRAMRNIYANCPSGYEVDHKIPLTRGGLHHPSNMQYLPSEANRSKGNRLPHECPEIQILAIGPNIGDAPTSSLKAPGPHRFFDGTSEGRKRNGRLLHSMKLGVHSLSKEQLREAGRRGGLALRGRQSLKNTKKPSADRWPLAGTRSRRAETGRS